MPGLKVKGLSNLNSVIERRQREKSESEQRPAEDNPFPQIEAQEIAPEFMKKPDSGEVGARMYEKIFERIGTTTRRRYESGAMPWLHKLMFDEIRQAIGVSGIERQIVLTPLIEKLGISRAQCLNILSCLEHYGYLSMTRLKGRGKPIAFTILKM
jgi:hypothetical protein